MTETPKCPYCGEEMKRITGRYLDGLYRSRYCCPKCDACATPGQYCGRAEDAQASALAAALRRAEPENRVLGLGEAQRICAKGDAVLLEEMETITEKQLTDIKLAHVSFLDEQNGACYIHTFFVKFPLMGEKYGKTWRCWLRKPTKEEMEREKWKE